MQGQVKLTKPPFRLVWLVKIVYKTVETVYH